MKTFDRHTFTKAINSMGGRYNLWQVWSDFLTMSAISITNAVDLRQSVWQEREDVYLRTVERYSKEDMETITKLFACVVDELDREPYDFLGNTFMSLELGNKWAGQFFTPDSLCRMMGEVIYTDEIERKLRRNDFVTVSEPAVGGGATIIGLVNALMKRGINYQKAIHVTAVDVDIRSVHMAYIQLSLLHVPAVIVHGNTLNLEEWSHWYTPAHIIGGWSRKLRQAKDNPDTPEPVFMQSPGKVFSKDDQIGLFGEANE